ncbi:HAMP domain-containing sensor histidine kinase [Microbacterium esteraromaticum]|uniref:sensor histidine kinase n=1 Tax=Microbacterium esteraromaticum TaxID=57043 RepID=UPI001C96003D|nr:HAMP domain-containing sensor histidine kinase [Microbacterium esteraromaticum]MBY6061698.1 HAMP domain-containing histidine kinase [Microbacterium esteraromaticum]
MANGSDAVTQWWRRISLRAKVTGVTVAVLALGLVIAGIGTVPILRTAMIDNIDAQLPALATTGQAERFFDVSVGGDGQLVFDPAADAPRATDFVVAFYQTDGTMIAEAGGQSADRRPVFPETFTLQQAKAREDQVIPLSGPDGLQFHAAVSPQPAQSAQNVLYLQVVALPLDEADRIVGTYSAVYTTVALVTILLAALLTRVLVTLTFRRLGHVESTAMAIAAGDFSQRLTDLEPTTEVGRLNAAINTMLDRVDRSIAQRDRTVQNMRRFIGDASHELRTPLVSVRGYAELYRMGAIHGDEDTARAMERIEKEAIRMGVLVEDLLALARLDEERSRELQIEPLDLRPIARDAALDVRVAAPARTVTVIDKTADGPVETHLHAPASPTPTKPTPASGRAGGPLSRLRRRPKPTQAEQVPSIDFTEATDAPVRTPPIVLGEDNKVRQVVTNLLGNARRFSSEDAPIEIVVGADRRRGVGTIAVVDHGDGIPPQIREHIFERFWRADTSRARETGGAGLGLAIVASIIESLHGTVRVDETPGGGATFVVSLPLAPPQATPAHLLEETQPLQRLDL